MALYVYGLMRASDGAKAASNAAEQGPAVQAVARGELCALVSSLPEGDIVLRRESALAHTNTLQEAFRAGPVLPLRFGTVLNDEGQLERELLGARREQFLARLEVLDGLAEMQVKASYLEEPLLRSILAADSRLAEAATRIRQLPDAATHFDRIALGEAISGAVEARRTADSHKFIEKLKGLAVGVDVREPSHERGMLNAAFLVPQSRLEAFDKAVERLSEQHAGEMTLKLIGPMPAYSFAQRSWEQELGNVGSGAWA